MKKSLFLLCAVALFCAPSADAIDLGIDLRVKAGGAIPAPIIVAAPPLFLVPPKLGLQVAVGVPYDMFRVDGRFYLHKGDAWFAASGYDGPWKIIEHRHLPLGLAKRRLGDMLALREAEYVSFKKDKNHYRGKTYRPEKRKGGSHGNDNGKSKGNGKGK